MHPVVTILTLPGSSNTAVHTKPARSCVGWHDSLVNHSLLGGLAV